MRKAPIFLTMVLFAQCSFAQIGVVQRAELEINKKIGDNYKVLSLNENGILVFIESEEFLKGSKKEFIITKYDSTLQQSWVRSFVMDYDSRLGLHDQDGDYLYFLIAKESKQYDILKIHLPSGLLVSVKYERIVEMDITHFVALENILLFGGTVDSRPVVVHYDYVNGKPKVLPAINTLKAALNRLEVCKADNSIFVLLTPLSNKKKESFFYNIFDMDGTLLTNTIVPYEKDYILYTFQPYLVSRNEQYLFGMYSLLAKDKAQGVYVTHIVNNEQDFIRFYDFSYFKNFFNYLGKRKEKTLSKIKGERQDGNIYKHDYNFLVRELKFLDDKLLLLADSYSPLYREGMNSAFVNPNMLMMRGMNMSYRNLMNVNDYMRMPASRGPVGYRYKHGIVCAFDKKGKMLWDNSLEYKDLETMASLSPQLQVSTGTDSLTLLNFQEKKIYYKRTDKSLAVETIREVEIPSKEEAESKIDEREQEAVMQWYGDYFLMYGIQKMKSIGGLSNQRKVFYLSKLGYIPPSPEEKKSD